MIPPHSPLPSLTYEAVKQLCARCGDRLQGRPSSTTLCESCGAWHRRDLAIANAWADPHKVDMARLRGLARTGKGRKGTRGDA